MKKSVVGGLWALLLATAAGAHHSFAGYDLTRSDKLVGTVAWVRWTNPHCSMRVVKADGSVMLLEYGTPGVNLRMGWKADTIKVGQKLKIFYAPKRGDPGDGSIETVILPDGKVLRTPIYYIHLGMRPANAVRDPDEPPDEQQGPPPGVGAEVSK